MTPGSSFSARAGTGSGGSDTGALLAPSAPARPAWFGSRSKPCHCLLQLPARGCGMTFFDVADLAFAVNSAGVHRARRNSRYARTSYGLAVPRHGGVHYCLGHLIARTDMSEALAALARRLREPRVSGDA